MTSTQLDPEELRQAGISRTGLAWLTNPIRRMLFHLALPYFEVIVRAVNHNRAELAGAALEVSQQHLAGAMLQVQEEARARIRAGLDQHLIESVIQVREEALAGVRAEVRRELAGARAEMRAMSHRFASIEEMLHTMSRWLEGVERHNAELSDETRAALTTLRKRIETAECMVAADAGACGEPRLGIW